MLDAFLEVVHGRTKQAKAEERTRALLSRLPAAELHKIASMGQAVPMATKAGSGDGCWLDKFRGSPLLDQAIAIEKEELEIQMAENARRAAQREVTQQYGDWDTDQAARDEISIKRRLLELELAGADVSNEMGGQEGEDAAPPDTSMDTSGVQAGAIPQPTVQNSPPSPDTSEDKKPAGLNPRFTEEGNGDVDPAAKEDGPPVASSQGEEKPKAEKPKTTKITTVEKPTEDKERVDIKAAAARMRFKIAASSFLGGERELQIKEAFGAAMLQGLKGMGQFAAGATKHIAGATRMGGVKGGLEAAGQAGRLGMQNAGKFIQQNPGASAALVAAPAAAVGYAAGRQ